MGTRNTKIIYSDTVPFIPIFREALVIKVYDGDTFTIGFFQSNSDKPYRVNVRMLGIDTPEIKDRDLKKKKKAKAAQEFLSSQILGKSVTLKNVSLDKYGRLLANVYVGDIHINKLMIDEHYAIAYFGGHK